MFFFFLSKVVIGKIRSEVTEHNQQHIRAGKAFLIIIPLLGITYLITMFPPVNTEGIGYQIFQAARSILLSTQVSEKQDQNCSLYPGAFQ